MNYVEPIRDKTTVQDLADYLKDVHEKYYIMYMIGIYKPIMIRFRVVFGIICFNGYSVLLVKLIQNPFISSFTGYGISPALEMFEIFQAI